MVETGFECGPGVHAESEWCQVPREEDLKMDAYGTLDLRDAATKAVSQVARWRIEAPGGGKIEDFSTRFGISKEGDVTPLELQPLHLLAQQVEQKKKFAPARVWTSELKLLATEWFQQKKGSGKLLNANEVLLD